MWRWRRREQEEQEEEQEEQEQEKEQEQEQEQERRRRRKWSACPLVAADAVSVREPAPHLLFSSASSTCNLRFATTCVCMLSSTPFF
jgi:nucleosome binding factor SPN SPT16 subunit